ncbi:MAG: bifunctional methylenetetrahydrofolate dehydrogenase/methenyltetrahydrofolate cyclohydrolase FolD [Lachnospiraceae bacterium]|jgi:methylenetetrahydrofolate dehydrogenase (NADP+)/methenyltetrahydrofolate cyclohydrolase|nr:bifunctional methylenetetrahydrofolate dehydrogenase/methenyltetrahydrofolate cyclohydrolase FolD [Lachnospiraceae bacterium]
METRLIDGKQVAGEIRREVSKRVAEITAQGKAAPHLSVVLVGEDPASQTYVKGKEKACSQVGISSETIRLPENVAEEELLQKIEELNADPAVNGILVQLPLPEHIQVDRVIQMIAPDKDVDSFHIENLGHLMKGGSEEFLPCTPNGVVELLRRNQIKMEGKHCVVVGRSNLVGKPAALLLLEENATVTVCHSHTQDLASICRLADILVVAAGKPGLIDGSMIKPGAVVIDVGIHRMPEGLCGDVDTESCMGIAGAITPVPGGVGPMTVAMLLLNCVQAYEKQAEKNK